jgi:uncharacterized membrane protein
MAEHCDTRNLVDDVVYPARRAPRYQALHAKLDELLRASGKARDELTEIDQEESEEIEEQRRDARG